MLTALIATLLGTMTLAAVAQPGDLTEGDDTPDLPLDQPDAASGDIVQAGLWSDQVDGTAQDDWLAGGRSCDTLEGHEGNDTLYGERGRDLLEGGTGNDFLNGNAWHDALDGGAGDDTLLGDTGKDTLLGGEGDDEMSGGEWDDLLIGGAGSDAMTGDGGDDLMYAHVPGPSGDDMTARAFHESLEHVFDHRAEFDALSEQDQQAAAETLFDEMLQRYPGAPAGADGADTLDGGAGDDTLHAGDGDEMIGGAGDDDFVVSDWTAQSGGTGALIDDFGLGDDELIVEYDASTGAAAPEIAVTTFANGDQVVTADGLTVATLLSPAQMLDASDVLVVGVMV
ncbi:calcium-binding protein [Sagittula stellata]|uniref:Beta-lactamase, putative n=1 Tax=Sagittula stellata (strain ATCC 700073 / DSM 11524 / E-37) TaxID=388399 RepID=A3JYC0_SAGS3|nr:calcium-binding protein [Sagittula stellata]EBA10506.1 beta-lactamase, putative [Sagittula stellata E-37]